MSAAALLRREDVEYFERGSGVSSAHLRLASPPARDETPDAWTLARELLGAEPGEVLDAGIGASDPAAGLAAIGHRITRLVGDDSAGGACWTTLSGPVPLLDETFDLIVLADGLEHVPDLAVAAHELARLLAPGGALVLTRPAGVAPETARCAPEDLERCLIRAGLAITEILERTEEDVFVATRDDRWGLALAEAARNVEVDPLAASHALGSIAVHDLAPQVRREVLLVGTRALLACGMLEGALEMASAADRVDPTSIGAMLGLAEVATKIGDHRTALDACREATRRGPDSPSAWRALAEIFDKTGEPNAAQEALDRALAAGPADLATVRAALAMARRHGSVPRAAELEARERALEEKIRS